MYIEVCNEKNDLQDTLKVQYDAEYEKKLMHQVDKVVSSKLDEQQSYLSEKWSQERGILLDEYRKKLDANAGELKILRDQISELQEVCEKTKLEKANLQIKFNQIEAELKEKCLSLERSMQNNEGKHKSEIESSRAQTESLRKDLENHRLAKEQLEHRLSQSEKRLNDLQCEYESEKQKFVNLIEASNREKKTLSLSNEEMSKRLELEASSRLVSDNLKIKELESKLVEVELIANQCELKLNAAQIECGELEVKLQHEQEKFKTASTKWENEASILNQKVSALQGEYDKMCQLNKRLENKSSEQESENLKLKKTHEQLTSRCTQELNEKLEAQKQVWNQERNSLISKKDEELQKVNESNSF